MHGANESGNILGIEYGLYKKWDFSKSTESKSNNESFAPINNGKGFNLDTAYLSGEAHGTWTDIKEKNPNNLATADISLGYSFFKIDYSAEISAKTSLEGDQDFKNTHKVNSGQIYGYRELGDANTYFEILFGWGQVDASNDDARKTLTDKLKFNRANAELYYNAGLPKSKFLYFPLSLGFNYRYFKEISPPAEIKQADLDQYRYGGIQLIFNKGVYMAYTAGKLPFDEKSNHVISIGFSQNLF